jgi:hypothetical protein
MLDCPVFGQSGTGMKRSADAGTSLVPEKGDSVYYWNALVPDLDFECQNVDASGINLNADAQL